MVYHTARYGKGALKKGKVVSSKAHTPTKEKKRGHKKSRKSPKNSSMSPKSTPPIATPKKTSKTPKKAKAQHRVHLPDLEDETTNFIEAGDLFRDRLKYASASEDDDDLKVTYMSGPLSDSGARITESADGHIDLTNTRHPTQTSTPKDNEEVIVIGEPMPRRSPRNAANTKATNTKPTTSKDGKSAPGKSAKKTLKYDNGQEGTSAESRQSSNAPTVDPQLLAVDEDLGMRVARLESLLTSVELQRRADNTYACEAELKNKELHERITSLLERCAADRETLLKGFQYATENQKGICNGE